jgi:hypothetical protein
MRFAIYIQPERDTTFSFQQDVHFIQSQLSANCILIGFGFELLLSFGHICAVWNQEDATNKNQGQMLANPIIRAHR